MDEKRGDFRSPTDLYLKFQHKGLLDTKEGELQVLDVSAKGMGIRCNQNFGIGSTIKIILDPETNILSKIIYKETSNYGLEFIDKNQVNIDTLLAYCKKTS